MSDWEGWFRFYFLPGRNISAVSWVELSLKSTVWMRQSDFVTLFLSEKMSSICIIDVCWIFWTMDRFSDYRSIDRQPSGDL